ncbi:MAG: PilZ domain-containing protein [Rhodospirillaceae bacterium]|nr:PilZ domain-containing protein [Rhodospirillaceae bacterium]
MSDVQVVGHTWRNRRHDKRLKAPLTVITGEKPFTVDNWSLGGFIIRDPVVDLVPESSTQVRLLVPFPDGEVTLDVTIKVVRNGGDEPQFAANFVGLDNRAVDALDRYASRRFVRSGPPQSPAR